MGRGAGVMAEVPKALVSAFASSNAVKDAALSRREHGFESVCATELPQLSV